MLRKSNWRVLASDKDGRVCLISDSDLIRAKAAAMKPSHYHYTSCLNVHLPSIINHVCFLTNRIAKITKTKSIARELRTNVNCHFKISLGGRWAMLNTATYVMSQAKFYVKVDFYIFLSFKAPKSISFKNEINVTDWFSPKLNRSFWRNIQWA